MALSGTERVALVTDVRLGYIHGSFSVTHVPSLTHLVLCIGMGWERGDSPSRPA